MASALQSHLAFHLTGRRHGDGLAAVNPSGLDLRPALLARYRDLTALRYDYPVVLVAPTAGAPAEPSVASLSGVMDGLLQSMPLGDDSARVSRHLLRLEREIRTLAAEGASGSLTSLWTQAAATLGAAKDDVLKDSLDRARTALALDGDVVDCHARLSSALVTHLWRAVHDAKTRAVTDAFARLVRQLTDILRADDARSPGARTAEALRASIGDQQTDLFDFDAMARVLGHSAAAPTLTGVRRRRIESLIATIRTQRFTPISGGPDPYPFVFDAPRAALAAYRERMPKLTALARALFVADLEVRGEYREARHDAIVEDLALDQQDVAHLAWCPDYLVCLNAARASAEEQAALLDALSSGLPIKLLVQIDDLLTEDGQLDLRSRQLASMAMGLTDVFVLQATASQLFQRRGDLLDGLEYRGPALFSVFSGASAGAADLPPYLVAAAALESRAFPAFTYNPSAGREWTARLDLSANPQPLADWPVARLDYEDDTHKAVTEDLPFTFVEFVACDRRGARHLARVPRAEWNGSFASVGESLTAASSPRPAKVPSLLMVDAANTLQRVLVDDRLVRDARRCRDLWVAMRAGTAAPTRTTVAAGTAAAPTPTGVATGASVSAAPVVPDVPVAPAVPDDAPFIETPRCSTCNECTQINNRMFAYNENKQAYIANPDAGTYRQLVEAAESCQVSIIHPGKPRNPDEPGLDELVVRAQPFL